MDQPVPVNSDMIFFIVTAEFPCRLFKAGRDREARVHDAKKNQPDPVHQQKSATDT